MSSFVVSDGFDVTEPSDATKRLNVSVGAAAAASTALSVECSQTATRTLTLPDLTSTAVTQEDVDDVWFITDEKASGTDGGDFENRMADPTNDGWRTRDLNTLRKLTGTGTEVTITSNRITLTAGTYYVQFNPCAFDVGMTQSRLQNITDATTELLGIVARTTSAPMDDSTLQGVVTAASTKVYEVQHRAQNTKLGDGFGKANGFAAVEVYTDGRVRKLAT